MTKCANSLVPAPSASRGLLWAGCSRMGAKSVFALSLFVSACGSNGEEAASGRARTDRRPNILLIQWDTVRADRLACYGYTKPTTPHLDAMAGELRLYEQVITPGTWTLPAVASIFTGYYPSKHGASGYHTWLDDEFVAFPEILKEAGYATYIFSANAFLSKDHNMVPGFELAEHPWDEKWTLKVVELYRRMGLFDDPGSALSGVSPKQINEVRPYMYACGPVANEAFLGWLRQRDTSKPFCAMLCYMEAHLPRIPPRDMRERVMTPEAQAHGDIFRLAPATMVAYQFGLEELNEADLAVISGHYDATIAQLDRVTHELFESLRTMGLLDNTVVVLYSDHGENLGEHHLLDHQYTVYRTVTDVPLMIRYPALFPPGRDSTPVNLIDLYPTLLEVAGVKAATPADVQGHSLLGPQDDRPDYRVSEYPWPLLANMLAIKVNFRHFDQTPWMRRLRMLEQGDYRYVWASAGPHELYHRRNDPAEERNLIGEKPEVAQRMQATLDTWAQSFKHYKPRSDAKPIATPLSPEVREALKALGYAED